MPPYSYFLLILTAVAVLAEVPLEERQTPELVPNVNDQYHNQDSLGQYKYSYTNGESSKEESRSLDGVTKGSYSYMDANGVLQRVVYQADAERGFRVSGTNIPSSPLSLDSSEEITPAFSTRLNAAARRISTDEDKDIGNLNISDQVTSGNNIEEDRKVINNDKYNDFTKNIENNNLHYVQQQEKSDKKNGGHHYLFPLARPNHELSPSNAEYLMPISPNYDYYVQPNQMSSSQGDEFTFLPLFQPEFIPPFARSYYRSPFAFLNGFIPLFRAQRSGSLPIFSRFNQFPINRKATWNPSSDSRDNDPTYNN